MTVTRKLHLSPARRHLVELGHYLNYGRIERLRFANGEPVLDRSTRTVRQRKLGKKDPQRPLGNPEAVASKEQWTELFEHFDTVRDGEIEVIEIQEGLPFRMSYDDVIR